MLTQEGTRLVQIHSPNSTPTDRLSGAAGHTELSNRAWRLSRTGPDPFPAAEDPPDINPAALGKVPTVPTKLGHGRGAQPLPGAKGKSEDGAVVRSACRRQEHRSTSIP